jgi:glycosyltransferase involved in cell wall biosynthesis
MYLIDKRISPILHCSQDVTEEFERAILSDKTVKAVRQGSQLWFLPLYYMDKIVRKFGIHIFDILTRFFILDSSKEQNAYFTVMMGGDFIKYYPYSFLNRKKRYAYFFDAWTQNQPEILDFIRKYKIDHVFVSASQAAIGLNEKTGHDVASWIPEGIDISVYKQLPYNQKDIDVIQIGRKYDWYHEQITPFLNKINKIYLYERTKGKIIFPTREGYINGLAKSKISICFPSNITHPERAGVIETMTNRYLQSMASKCLIVGHAPQEMLKLFAYNPVVEIDRKAPAEQLKTILDHYSDYIPLIEKNFEVVSNHHTWKKRWEQVRKSII